MQPTAAPRRNVFRGLLRYFAHGCLVFAPLGATLYVAYLVFKAVDGILPTGIPGLGFVVTVTAVTFAGFVSSKVGGRAFMDAVDERVARVPLLKLVYGSIRDLLGAFVGGKKRFSQPVLVALGDGVRALGFVTREGLAALRLDGHVAVYLPLSYNLAGHLIFVPRDRIQPVDIDTSDAFTFIVSGGVSGLGVAPEPEPQRTIIGFFPVNPGT